MLETQEEYVLNKLIEVFEKNPPDWWKAMSDSEKVEVEIGFNEADKDNLKEHGKVMVRFYQWK